MNQGELRRPLSSSERGELRAFLESVPSAMPLPQADGFLTGIASMPTTLMPSDWQPRLLGGEHTFSSIDEAEQVLGLIMRLLNEILSGLNKGREIRPPASLDDEQLGKWCKGYLEACRMDSVWWNDEKGHAALLSFGALAGEFDLVGEESADGKIIEDPSAHLTLYRRELPIWVLALHQYWVAWRRDQMETPSPPPGPKAGRNDRCPCGSGLKYKKCCGIQPAGPH